ncbi:MAG: hypothetical protein ACKV2T_01655 [Kofleriaceae bacterium]
MKARVVPATMTARALLILSLAGCGPAAPPTAEPEPAIAVGWGERVTIYDVLGRDPTLLQAVEIPARDLPRGITVQAATSVPGYRVVTACDDGYCVDGVVSGEHVTADGALAPCAAVGGLRAAAAPTDECDFVIEPVLSPDDRAILGAGHGSWVERGIQLTYRDDAWLSFYDARADFTDGAAHSHGALRCRTRSIGASEPPLRPWARTEVDAVSAAVTRFLDGERARSEGGDIAWRVDMSSVEDLSEIGDHLVTGPRSVDLCLPLDPQEIVHVRVTLEAVRDA